VAPSKKIFQRIPKYPSLKKSAETFVSQSFWLKIN